MEYVPIFLHKFADRHCRHLSEHKGKYLSYFRILESLISVSGLLSKGTDSSLLTTTLSKFYFIKNCNLISNGCHSVKLLNFS